YDKKVGTRKWEYLTKGPVFSSPVIASGAVYIGSTDQNLYVLDESNGKFMWKYGTADKIYSAPVVSDGKVFFSSVDGSLYAVQ
ncbi:MAG: PQQ-binding-like beta-propeller repeat protein, partial [Gammaproteobacteria bacterium]|nr:PQQ-binding-like beta-propeller repeat protein [Gammaproteobacteria bacterium]